MIALVVAALVMHSLGHLLAPERGNQPTASPGSALSSLCGGLKFGPTRGIRRWAYLTRCMIEGQSAAHHCHTQGCPWGIASAAKKRLTHRRMDTNNASNPQLFTSLHTALNASLCHDIRP